MRLFVGTSGFSYKPWKGPFYPEDLPDDQMLSYYAGKLPAVEINNTFYRMPKTDMLERWADSVPETFRFALKASQRITHRKRLNNTHEEVGYFFETLSVLRDRLGPVLFQLPPNARANVERLRDFLGTLPEGRKVAFEFRHPSWFEPEVLDTLRDGGAALCIAESEDADKTAPVEATASWGYLRLRRDDYDDAALEIWAERVRAQTWDEAYVFFKHEDAGTGPRLAARLREMLEGSPED
jgi:uncharacterized protein YecE (DUF72 family)